MKINLVVGNPKIINTCLKHNVQRLYLFGSSLSDKFDSSTSDIDFLVEFKRMTPVEYADCYFGLLEELQQIIGSQVDLVELIAIRNPYFLRAIEQKKVLIYAAA